MAFIKGCELCAKLSGLLVERVEVSTTDIAGALARAEKRVLDITPSANGTMPSSLLSWQAKIPGDNDGQAGT